MTLSGFSGKGLNASLFLGKKRSSNMEHKSPGPSSPSTPTVVQMNAGQKFDFGAYETHWKIDGSQTGGLFAIVHHPLKPRMLAAPLHRHHRQDEYSYVLAGTFGALLGDAVVTAEPGTWVFCSFGFTWTRRSRKLNDAETFATPRRLLQKTLPQAVMPSSAQLRG